MGNIFSYIADSFTNRGALDLVTEKDKETLGNAAFLSETKPITQAFTPQANNLVAQEFAQQTMTALPRTAQELAPGQMGPPLPNAQTYSDPAAATRRYYDRLADQERARETARAQEQLSDPMFRFRDTVTDVARNTIGLPFNILSGGQAFNNDPSREAQSRHEARLEELDNLNGVNANLYDQARDKRFVALETMRNQRYVSDTNRLNAMTSSGKSRREDILAGVAKVNPTYYTSESFNKWYKTVQAGEPNFDLLEFKKNIEIRPNAITGLSEIIDVGPDGGENRLLGTLEDYTRDADAGQFGEMYGLYKRDQATYFNERGSYSRKIDSWNSKTSEIQELIDEAKASIDKGGSGLVGNALQDYWFTEGKTLKQKLATLQARIGFDKLQAMRTDPDNKTGGALGQVAVQELEALQKSIRSLDQAQTPEELKRALDFGEAYYISLGENLENQIFEMDQEFGTRQNPRLFSDIAAGSDNPDFRRYFNQSPLVDPATDPMSTEAVSDLLRTQTGSDGLSDGFNDGAGN